MSPTRENFSQKDGQRVSDRGCFGIHWPDIDEDLSTEDLLRGVLHLEVPLLSASPARG